MKPAIAFEYDTIYETLLPMNSICALKFCVKLGAVNKKTDMFIPSSQEYVYRSKRPNQNMIATVKRRWISSLVIEYKDQDSILGREQIRISAYDILGFRRKINTVDEKLMDAFIIKGDELILPADNNFKITSRPGNSAISFSPTIVEYENQSKVPGVTIYLNEQTYIDIPIRTWKAFVYYIDTADLFGWGLALVSKYIDKGKDVVEMDNDRHTPPIDDFADIENQTLKPNSKGTKEKGFFD